MSNISSNYCLNCSSVLVEGSDFCHRCGQSKRAGILSFKELWDNFWTTIFNVDNSFFTTLRLIARPDKLTSLYVAGRRKKHINPVRLFLISLVFFAAAFIYIIGDFGDDQFLKNLNRDYYNSLLLERYDNTIGEMRLTDQEYEQLESIKAKTFEGVVCSEVDTVFDGMTIIDVGTFRSITKGDFLDLSEEEIYDKYGAKTFFEKLNYRQYIRINKDPNASNKFLFSNALWGLVPCMLVLSLFLKLLYRNHKIAYLEHLVFVLNTHSFLLLFWMVFAFIFHWFLLDYFNKQWVFPFVAFSNIVFVFVMMFKYYREGFFRSLIKYFLALIVYTFFGFFFIVISMVISGFTF